jgi:hypothetical protein
MVADGDAGGDAGGEGGRGTDVGSARCDGSHGGSVWRAGIRTAGADQIGIKSGTEMTRNQGSRFHRTKVIGKILWIGA